MPYSGVHKESHFKLTRKPRAKEFHEGSCGASVQYNVVVIEHRKFLSLLQRLGSIEIS
jgi:hypothetical protein